ncbi:MAG: MazG nucleotide pyrophosphohydrolase domain-containing protein [Sulfolobales archaeon]
MKISDAQELIRKKYFDRDSARGLFATYTWFIEEVGELAEALIEKDKESIEEEIADVFAWLLSIANLVGVNVQEAFVKKYVSQQG